MSLSTVSDMAGHSDEEQKERLSQKESTPINTEVNETGPGDSGSGEDSALELRYKLEDVPPWYLCIILGFQHYLTMLGATASVVLVLSPALCINRNDIALSEILNTMFFVSGLITILQTTFGIRLPIIQGGTFAYLVPTFSILSLPKWRCPSDAKLMNDTINGSALNITMEVVDLWQPRIREIQGAIISASLFQVVIGATGLLGYMMKYIGPLTIATTITLIGLALYDVASSTCALQWGIAALTILLIAVFSQYMRNIEVPIYSLKKVSTIKMKYQCHRSFYPIFKMFPVILAILIVWFFCFILTISGALPSGNPARTDINGDILMKSKWFRIPYPFQWGLPTFTWAGTLGMLAGVMAGMLESIGDYYACARMCGAPPPPVHAINRGVLMEGLGSVLSGMWGTGSGTTSYSENVGAIGITKVGSRRVIQTAGIVLMIIGMFGKFGALFVAIPSPIIGGVFMTMFGMIAAVGVSNLQHANLNSSRNLFVFGFSLFFGLSVSKWLNANPDVIQTGIDVLDQLITVLLSTSMFLGGTAAFILDNTIPGSLEERGIIKWKQHLVDKSDLERKAKAANCYDIPFISKYIRKHNWSRYIPICPTYKNYSCKCHSRNRTKSEVDDDNYPV